MKNLSHSIQFKVRFNDADPLGIVWHGNYVQYMEDAREAFGEKFGLQYLDVHAKGFVIPLVNVTVDYKQSIKYGDSARVEIYFVEKAAAKLVFDYQIYRVSDGKLAATGQTTQVFLNKNTMELELVVPQFFEAWKQKQLYD